MDIYIYIYIYTYINVLAVNYVTCQGSTASSFRILHLEAALCRHTAFTVRLKLLAGQGWKHNSMMQHLSLLEFLHGICITLVIYVYIYIYTHTHGALTFQDYITGMLFSTAYKLSQHYVVVAVTGTLQRGSWVCSNKVVLACATERSSITRNFHASVQEHNYITHIFLTFTPVHILSNRTNWVYQNRPTSPSKRNGLLVICRRLHE